MRKWRIFFVFFIPRPLLSITARIITCIQAYSANIISVHCNVTIGYINEYYYDYSYNYYDMLKRSVIYKNAIVLSFIYKLSRFTKKWFFWYYCYLIECLTFLLVTTMRFIMISNQELLTQFLKPCGDIISVTFWHCKVPKWDSTSHTCWRILVWIERNGLDYIFPSLTNWGWFFDLGMKWSCLRNPNEFSAIPTHKLLKITIT